MIKVFLGPDTYSKNLQVSLLAKTMKAKVEKCEAGEEGLNLDKFLETDLFSAPKVFVLDGVFKSFITNPKWEKFLNSEKVLVLKEESLDKRLKETKDFLSIKEIEVSNFLLPHGKDLDRWILEKVRELGGSMTKEAIDELARRLGRDEGTEQKAGGKVVSVTEVYDLYRAEGEVKKLLAAAGQGEVSLELVQQLVCSEVEIDPFKITNALAEGDYRLLWSILEKFFQGKKGADQKSACIQLTALLAEQFRSLLLVKSFLLENKTEAEVLEATGWKSGRLFVLKKAAARYDAKKLIETLKKLEALDEEVKTGNLPERALLDMILVQLK